MKNRPDNTFLSADLHLGHRGVTLFRDHEGRKIRPWDDVESMDEALIANWNEVVQPNDKVYLLGDLVINRRALSQGLRLNGRKTLIMGNHDTFRTQEYLDAGFTAVRGAVELDNMILTHIPVHPGQLDRYRANVHGHLHNVSLPDPRYLCVSVEQTGFRPVSLAWVQTQLEVTCGANT